MGNFQCKQNQSEKTLVIQTGKLRANNIGNGVKSFNHNNKEIIHRWLPSDLESKYEALDFVTKFNLQRSNYINIYNSDGVFLDIKSDTSLTGNEDRTNLLYDNVNIIVAIGSSSTQAFKLTMDGPKTLLPVTQSIIDDINVKGDKTNPLLNLKSISEFGGSSNNTELTREVIKYLVANAFNSNGVPTNIIFVNQLGYSVLGFDKSIIPSRDQKAVSITTYDLFTDNGGKTGLINVLRDIFKNEFSKDSYRFRLITRQCKVRSNGKEEELSGQWASFAYQMIENEPSLMINNKEKNSINRVLDLGGGSGTFYNLTERDTFEKDKNIKEFMKSKNGKPNDFENNIEVFINKFNEEYTLLKKLHD